MKFKLIALQLKHPNIEFGFKLSESNLFVLNDRIVSFGVVPNQTKAHLAAGTIPDMFILPAYNNGHICLMEIFFLAAIYSAQKNLPLTVVVSDEIMKNRLTTYIKEAYRPDIMQHLDTLNIPEEDKLILKKEYEYFDKFERPLEKMLNIITINNSGLDIKRDGPDYIIAGKRHTISDIKPVAINGLNPLSNWTPAFGVLIVGTASGTYGLAPATNFIVRHKNGETPHSLWIDSGPQMRELAQAAGENIENIDLIITHGHEDHDGGIWDLLIDDRCRHINLYTNPAYADSFYKKAEALNLLTQAREKVTMTEISPRNAATGDRSMIQINGLKIQTEWAIHGIPTISLKIEKEGKIFLYTADTAVSTERLGTLKNAQILSKQRMQQLEEFFAIKHCDLFIEELGAMLVNQVHIGGINHNNTLDTIKPQHIDSHRVVHFTAANRETIPSSIRANTMEPITIIP